MAVQIETRGSSTLLDGLEELVDWLCARQLSTAAMEAPGRVLDGTVVGLGGDRSQHPRDDGGQGQIAQAAAVSVQEALEA